MKKALSIISAILFAITAFADDGYSLDVLKVYPNKASIYSRTFKTRHDLDVAVASQTSSLKGKNGNYVITIKTPNGNKTQTVQNITWVEYVNGTPKYNGSHSPQGSYSSPTTWKGGPCNVYGKSGNLSTYEFIYRVKVEGEKDYRTHYLTKSSAETQAKAIYDKINTKENPVVVNVYKFSGGDKVLVSTKSNKKELEENASMLIARELQQRQDSVLAAFRADMRKISDEKDSLKATDVKSGIRRCYSALNNVLVKGFVSDSVLLVNGIDSLYLKVLTQDLLGDIENKKVVQLIEDFNKTYSHEKPDNYFNLLTNLAQELDLALLEGEPEEVTMETEMPEGTADNAPQKPATPKKPAAYNKEIENYKEEYDPVEENGFLCKNYYNKEKKQLMKVNLETEEYYKGKASLNSDGTFKWENENKVKHYDRDGNEIRDIKENGQKQKAVKTYAYVKIISDNSVEMINTDNKEYLYYLDRKKGDYIRVKSDTKEYWIGKGSFAPGTTRFEWFNEEKVKHYSPDGKEIKN
ncbi:MAG: hypothetical protein IKW83_11190 [Muribaculaceae bacterium]|nr:hypothetical protein [Muribaculaceae bacterium]